ncbi:MAG: dihydropteroate synthase [Clostridiales bacterium]|jgi:dihydropteroate synthase|nr:dihydropteroate synthase [Clostridiales bacterium]
MRIGNKVFDTKNETYLMGILNCTPDSFYDGGKWTDADGALFHAEEMLNDGAAIIDVGGESTRPGHRQISEAEEIARTAGLIERIRARLDVPISIDTYKAGVARAAIDAGAALVNDIWGLRYDPDMAGLIAETGVCCCLTHNRESADYADFFWDMKAELYKTAKAAKKAGIDRDKIILDPGVGFAKSTAQNLACIARIREICELGYPVLLGASNKSCIGETLSLPKEERTEGTLVTTVFGVLGGCAFIRVHDVKANKRAIDMTKALTRYRFR